MMVEDVGQRLTTEQRVFLVKTFYQTNSNSETCRGFDEQFNRQIKLHTVTDIVERFEENGTVDDEKRSGRPAVVRTVENTAAVTSVFSNDPITSTRHAASELDILETSILRMLSDLHLRPYRPRLVQQ